MRRDTLLRLHNTVSKEISFLGVKRDIRRNSKGKETANVRYMAL